MFEEMREEEVVHRDRLLRCSTGFGERIPLIRRGKRERVFAAESNVAGAAAGVNVARRQAESDGDGGAALLSGKHIARTTDASTPRNC